MGLLSSFTILLIMATFTHHRPGGIQPARKLIVSDVVTATSTTAFTIQQPKGSIITNIFVRAIDDIVMASGKNLGVKVGTEAGGAQVVTASATNLVNSGSSVTLSAGAVITLSVENAVKFNGQSASLATDDRDIHFTVTATGATATNGNGQLEFTIVFREFE